MNLEQWLQENMLVINPIALDLCQIADLTLFCVLEGASLFDKDFNVVINKEQWQYAKQNVCNAVLYEFGEQWYYTRVDFQQPFALFQPDFTDFKYLGECTADSASYINLGVHGEYELLNGTGAYADWCQKAKFLGMASLGLCEKNTLAGTLSFQMACQKKGIKPILGETITIKFEDVLFTGKCYIVNERGWRNLLRINKAILVDNDGFIDLEDLTTKFCVGLIFVFGVDTIPTLGVERFTEAKFGAKFGKFEKVFYQFDTVEYLSDNADMKNLIGLREYLNWLEIPPILIADCYYLDKSQSSIKLLLNKIAEVVHPQSNDQYFKTLDDLLQNMVLLFPEEEMMTYLLSEMLENVAIVENMCNFTINTGQHKLPKYEAVTLSECGGDKVLMKQRRIKFWEERGLPYEDYEALFNQELLVGWTKKLATIQADTYWERLKTEKDVIIPAGFIHYFLILWDMIRWAKENGIYVGVARGSVAGSLVAYLLDITDIDPVQYDLLFERFLNKTRVSGERAMAADALPDIDIDFEGAERDNVKKYLEYKYGVNYVCSIGAYDRLKLRSSVKDFSALKGLSFTYRNHITAQIPQQLEYEWLDIFRFANNSKELYEFVQKYPELINIMKVSMGCAKNSTVHASAVIIVPNKDADGNDVDLFDWMPVKKMLDKNGGWTLVCEWEGKYTDRAGFLKEDILGLNQLDKFKCMSQLVEQQIGEKIDFSQIPLDDELVYQSYAKGFVEDVFQFGSDGLRSYCKKLKPTNIEHIIAANALYRPGAMSSNAHEDFVKILHGEKEPQYDYGLREVTENTYGLYAYQEQIMRAVHVLGGLSLSEADEVRTIMKKFDKVKMATFKDKFLAGAVAKGCPAEEAGEIWAKLERFSGYGFNRSHAAAYSIMSYWSMWVKVHIPLAFWTAALQFSGEGSVPYRIFEMKQVSPTIKVYPPDINISGINFAGSFENNAIYWALNKIKGIGDKMVEKVLLERSNGLFVSLSDFMARMKEVGGVGKDKILSLIFSGAFDGLHDIKEKQYRSRATLVAEWGEYYKVDLVAEGIALDHEIEYIWVEKQKELTGFGEVDIMPMLKKKTELYMYTVYKTSAAVQKLNTKNKQKHKATIVGNVDAIYEQKFKKDASKKFAQIRVRCQDGFVDCLLWPETWAKYQDTVIKAKDKQLLLVLHGEVAFDSYKSLNVLYSLSTTKPITL